MNREAVIVAGARTAVGRAKKGSTRNTRSDEMAATVIRRLLQEAGELDDVILGCARRKGSILPARLPSVRACLLRCRE